MTSETRLLFMSSLLSAKNYEGLSNRCLKTTDLPWALRVFQRHHMSSKGTTAYQEHHRPTLGTTGLHRHDQPVRDIIGLGVASLAYQGLPGVRRSCQRHRRPARLRVPPAAEAPIRDLSGAPQVCQGHQRPSRGTQHNRRT